MLFGIVVLDRLPLIFVCDLALANRIYWFLLHTGWTVVKVKRYIERWHEHHDPDGETRSELSASTQLTYPDVGEWAYGGRFQKYVSVCICVQQLAICKS